MFQCIAPDYLLCTKETEAKFLSAAKRCLKEWFGDEPQKSEDLSRIVSDRHFDRIMKLLETTQAEVAFGEFSSNLVN